MRPTSPNPIEDPKGYQDHLLALLGDDDPAEVQLGAVARWRELLMSARYRWILAHDEPPLLGYDQDLWADRLHEDGEDPELLVAVLEPLKVANAALWRDASPGDRERVGLHAERGPQSFDLSYRMIAGHDRFHHAQAERAIVSIRGG